MGAQHDGYYSLRHRLRPSFEPPIRCIRPSVVAGRARRWRRRGRGFETRQLETPVTRPFLDRFERDEVRDGPTVLARVVWGSQPRLRTR